jgi:hypothetical protein
MSIKEQVKSGQLTPQEAMAQVSPDSHTYGWCKRRKNKVVTPHEAMDNTPVAKAPGKYRHKPGK